jgi:hypothetical protein
VISHLKKKLFRKKKRKKGGRKGRSKEGGRKEGKDLHSNVSRKC